MEEGQGEEKRGSGMSVQYLSQEQVAHRTGIPLHVVRAAFDEARTHPRLQIKTKGPQRGRLCIQSAATFDTFRSVAEMVADEFVDEGCEPEPPLVIQIGQFAKACAESISSARGLSHHHKASKQYQNLMCWTIDVTVEGITAPIRLDIACALAKRAGRLPADAYGEEIRGAMLDAGAETAKWLLSYDASAPLAANDPDSGNIDHVVPRSAGGSSCLCNLQVMRTRSNMEKSSEATPDVSGEPQQSLRVLEMLSRGVRQAHAEGRVDDRTRDYFERLMREEVSECLSMLRTREILAVVARRRAAGMGHGIAKGIRRLASSARHAPRRLVVGHATKVICSA